jgi:hypothetical protein
MTLMTVVKEKNHIFRSENMIFGFRDLQSTSSKVRVE